MFRKLFLLPVLVLALGPITACDDADTDRSEVRSHEIVGLSAWEHDGTRYTMLSIDGAVRIVAEGGTADGVVAIADEDGVPIAAASRGPRGPQYADVDLLVADDRLALDAAPDGGIDAETAALLDLVVHGELELAGFRAGLVADSDPELISLGCAIGWVIRAVDNAINTPELMMPSLSDWCG
jgi:hypothetical protein